MDEATQERIAKAEARALRAWRNISGRPVCLARKGANPTDHALRVVARGYGKRRKHWGSTTECGRIMYTAEGWQTWHGTLEDTTCQSCRRVARERQEWELQYGDGDGDAGMDAYDLEQIEEMWRVQAAWHEPDPSLANWVGEG